jgi:hypothetical protein
MRKGFAFQEVAADEVGDDDATLARVARFEADDEHSVAFQTASPAIAAILRTDSSGGDKARIACCADIIVAGKGVGGFGGTLRTVIAIRGRKDTAVADVAFRGKCERLEMSYTGYIWSSENSSRGRHKLPA